MSPASNQKSKEHWDGRTYGLKTLGKGASGLVLALQDKNLAVKISDGSLESRRDLLIEQEAYRRFGNKCIHITKCYNFTNPHGLVLERLDETVRHKLIREGIPTLDTILNWSLGAAKGLVFIHSKKVIQCDVGCHNMLLDYNGTLKLCDFSGSSIDGAEATVNYETRSQAPFSINEPDCNRDIFALGCAMYEMCAGHAPFHNRTEEVVTSFYAKRKFPPCPRHLKNQNLWDIIQKCWDAEYNGDTGKVASSIEELIRKPVVTNGKEIRNQEAQSIIYSSSNSSSNIQRKRQSKKQPSQPKHHEKRLRQKRSDTGSGDRQITNDNIVTRIQKAIREWF